MDVALSVPIARVHLCCQARLSPSRGRRVNVLRPALERSKAMSCASTSVALVACGSLAASLARSPPRRTLKTRQGRGRGRYRRLARLYRARRDRQGLRLGHRLREEDRLQGQRQDRRHLGRDGRADERGRLRPRHRLGRRLAAPRRRQARRSRSTPRSIPSWKTRRRAPAERALAHGRRQALRRALSVGPERADVQHRTSSRSAPKSWNVVFEEQTLPDGKSNKGRIQAYDGAIYIADAALYLMTKKPELGIKDPYELNEDQYKAALDLLRQQHALDPALLARRHRADRRLQERGRRRLRLLALSGQSAAGREEADRLDRARRRRDGLGRHHDDACRCDAPELRLSSGSSTRSSPKLQGDLAAWFGSVPAVPAACKGNALLTDEGCKTNGFENFEQIKFWKTPVAKCASAERPACPTTAG